MSLLKKIWRICAKEAVQVLEGKLLLLFLWTVLWEFPSFFFGSVESFVAADLFVGRPYGDFKKGQFSFFSFVEQGCRYIDRFHVISTCWKASRGPCSRTTPKISNIVLKDFGCDFWIKCLRLARFNPPIFWSSQQTPTFWMFWTS